MKTPLIAVLMLAVGFVAGRVSSPFTVIVEQDEPHVRALREFVAKNFAEEDTELVSVSEPVLFKDQVWRAVRVKTRNGFNARVFQDYFVTMEGDKPVKFLDADDRSKYPGGNVSDTVSWLKSLSEAPVTEVKKAAH